MQTRTALLLSFLSVLALCCAVYIAARLRRLAADRADAATRASATLAELHLAARELRERQANEPPPAADLSPGERLIRRYPGASTGTRPAE